jgi:hypothetical protein
MWEVLSLDFSHTTSHPEWGFSQFSSTPPGNCQDSSSIKQWLFPSKSFLTHYSQIILPFNAIWPRYWQCHKINDNIVSKKVLPEYYYRYHVQNSVKLQWNPDLRLSEGQVFCTLNEGFWKTESKITIKLSYSYINKAVNLVHLMK